MMPGVRQSLTAHWCLSEAQECTQASVAASLPLIHAQPASVTNLFPWEDNDVRLSHADRSNVRWPSLLPHLVEDNTEVLGICAAFVRTNSAKGIQM